jgi:hypothetical protein|tara:strand:+ start:760 stop:1008 length:249 start_codon:yes stop_codon:yes gene_type:complete
MIIDNIGQTTLVNGIVRIQAMKVQPGGEQVPSGEIEIPAVIAGPILDAIVGSVKELENQIKENLDNAENSDGNTDKKKTKGK